MLLTFSTFRAVGVVAFRCYLHCFTVGILFNELNRMSFLFTFCIVIIIQDLTRCSSRYRDFFSFCIFLLLIPFEVALEPLGLDIDLINSICLLNWLTFFSRDLKGASCKTLKLVTLTLVNVTLALLKMILRDFR